MWNDEKLAADHHADLLKVRARVASEKLQSGLPGQIGTTEQMKEYRLKVIDNMIEQAESEMAQKPAKQGEVYQ
jgi:hypothetical protein